MNLLMISTMLHYFAIIPFSNKILIEQYSNYILTIILSTTFSILWHTNSYPAGILFFMDYSFAHLWFLQDLYHGYNKNHLLKILFLNMFVFILNIFSSYKIYYYYTHSIWHIISAMKCYYVSKFII